MRLVGRPVRRRKKLPHQRQPDDVRLAYFEELRRRVTQPARRLVLEQLVPELPAIVAESQRGDAARVDARGARRVNKVIAEIAADFSKGFTATDAEELSDKYRRATSDRQRQQLARQLEVAVGVEVPINDVRLRPLIDRFTAANVSLIRTIPQRYFAQVEQKVIDGVGSGRRAEEIADDLERRYEVSESVAKVIARDQVGKFFADLNQARQTELGITHFIWATSDDERTCPICGPLDGNRYSWNRPPKEGLPGFVHPQCRCGADPDVATLVDDL